MDLSLIRELLAIVASSNIAEVEIEEKGTKIVVRKSGPVITMQAPFAPPAYAPPYGYGPPAYAPPPAPAAPEAPAAAKPSEPPAAPAGGVVVKAPIVGTFYASPGPDAPPFVAPGAVVQAKDVLCIIEAMKLMNEIECETPGTIRQVLVGNGEPVEYDQPLFIIDPA